MAYKSFASGYLVKENKVLLVHHKKFNKWTPPGGHIEENETPADAVVREWKEELGLSVEVLPAYESAFMGDSNSTPVPMPFHIDLEREGFDVPHVGYFFYIKGVEDQQLNLQLAEIHDAKWFSKEDLPSLETFDQVRALANYAIDHYSSKTSTTEVKPNYAFIDSQNLNLGVKSQGWALDFAKFRIFLKDKYKIEKAFLFIGYVPGNEVLYTDLQKYGYICIFKPTLETKNKIKGNVDAELVLQAMSEYHHYDKAIIVSGDGDFSCLVEYLFGNGKLLKLMVPNTRFSSLLRQFSRFIVSIQLFKDKLAK